jgi:molybdopterin/thiamine biosynthesis adenylyltransferase
MLVDSGIPEEAPLRQSTALSSDFGGILNRYRGQLDILDISKLEIPITIIGAGAIGSFTALALAKMGCTQITVYDDDIVEEHNLSNQYYRTEDIDSYKVDALKDIIQAFCNVEITTKCERFEDQVLETPIVISAVDSMDVRTQIFTRVKKDCEAVRLFVDGRMGALIGHVFCVPTNDDEKMELFEKEFIFPNEEAMQVRCTAKTTMFTVLGISSLISGSVVSWLSRATREFKIPFERMLDFTTMKVFPITSLSMKDDSPTVVEAITQGDEQEQDVA